MSVNAFNTISDLSFFFTLFALVIKQKVFIILFFFFTGFLFSQDIGGIAGENFKENKPDKVEEVVAENSATLDSLSWIPYFDEYNLWETVKIHPYKNDFTKLIDTISLVLKHSECDFAHPICGEINSDFGYRRKRFHYGIDIDLERGDPVLATFEGVVRIAKYESTYGRVVVIRHNNGLETLYGHLHKIEVKIGDKVEAGQVIGLGGSTGRSTGNHLHFEMRYLGEPINPNDLIDFENGILLSDTLHLNAEHFAYLKEVRARKYYRVRSGDSLSRISYRHGVSISKLCRLNGISRNSIIRIGQSIRYN